MPAQQFDEPKANILVVDDTPDNLRLLMGIFADHAYDVRTASNGKFALQSVQTTPPDLILLDIKMPGIDGYAVCEQLKADASTRDIPVIFISALGETYDKVKGFALGGVDYITKPFQAEEVLARVHTHLTLRNLQQGLQQEVARRRQAEEELRTLNQQLNEANLRLEDTNQRLQAANRQLRAANASKDTFFSIMAHDLRSPFTGLIGITEVIIENLDQYTKDEIHTRITRLHNSAEKVYALLTNLLTWARLQKGVLDCIPEEFSLALAVERTVRLLAANAQQKQIALSNLVPKDTLVYADPKMVDAVIRNLLSNALKFTPTGGSIELSVQSQADGIALAVADTGIGMSPADLTKLFRIDVKASRPGTAGEEGTGLGLILCKELVEKNGGTLRVASEPGKGTRFVFTLPRGS